MQDKFHVWSYADLIRLSGGRVSARQIQWWDEKGIAPCTRMVRHQRQYEFNDALAVLVCGELRHKQVGPKAVREHLAALRRAKKDHEIMLVSDQRTVLLDHDEALNWAKYHPGPVAVIDMGALRSVLRLDMQAREAA